MNNEQYIEQRAVAVFSLSDQSQLTVAVDSLSFQSQLTDAVNPVISTTKEEKSVTTELNSNRFPARMNWSGGQRAKKVAVFSDQLQLEGRSWKAEARRKSQYVVTVDSLSNSAALCVDFIAVDFIAVDFIAVDFSQRIREHHIKIGLQPHSMWLKPLTYLKPAARQLKQTAIKQTAIKQTAIKLTTVNPVISTTKEEKSVTTELNSNRFPARMNWSGGQRAKKVAVFSDQLQFSVAVDSLSFQSQLTDAVNPVISTTKEEKSVTTEHTSNRFPARMNWSDGLKARSSRLTACSLKLTLCPSKAGHLPQGRTGKNGWLFTRDSRLVTRDYKIEYSTVINIVNLLQRQKRVYNTSLPVCSKAGREAEEIAFRACELLLN